MGAADVEGETGAGTDWEVGEKDKKYEWMLCNRFCNMLIYGLLPMIQPSHEV